MKTTDETKKGLECCQDFQSCTEYGEPKCPYNEIKECVDTLLADALAYIQQLEAANAELLTKVEQLEAKCHQLERERDAAVDDIRQGSRCAVCRKFFKNGGDCSGGVYCLPLRFEWRGVKEE